MLIQRFFVFRIMAKTRFQINWLENPEFKDWVQEDLSNNYKAKCSACHTSFSLSNMGARALRSHANGAEHKRRIAGHSISMKLSTYNFNKGETIQNQNEPSSKKSLVNYNFHISDECIETKPLPQSKIKSFVFNDNITKAEIFWCLQTIITHKSMRSAAKDVEIFKVMFSDSEIANKMQLQRTKIAYSILYGLAPFFKDQLMSKITTCTYFAVGFDESLNKVTQKTQMDINIRFWDKENNQVCTRYFGSSFLGSATANEIRKSFKASLSMLNLKNIIQISMDGPNVNQKFFKDIKSELNTGEDQPEILNLGSCGLHTLHGAFKTSLKATNWQIVEFLRNLYNIFKNVPARHALYLEYTGSNLFPKKFCPIRWLQNSEVAERAIDMWPHLKIFIDSLKRDQKEPITASYQMVKSYVDNDMMCVKLSFFISLASEMESFLKEYQTDAPLVPFIYTSLYSIIKNIMARFVKKEILNITKINSTNLSKKNLLDVDEIDLGYTTRAMIRKINKEKKIADFALSQFRRECQICFKEFIIKLLEKSPLSYSITKATSCFDPAIAANINVRKIRCRNLLTILEEHHWINGIEADKADRQFEKVCSIPYVIEELKQFRRANQRVDHFWENLFCKQPDTEEITFIMKLVMIMYHGNANVERGFSVNAECLIDNMREETLVAQRLVYDSILATGKNVGEFLISKPLILSFRNARGLYEEELKRCKNETNAQKNKQAQKRQKQLEIKELKTKITKIQEVASNEVMLIQDKITSLKKE